MVRAIIIGRNSNKLNIIPQNRLDRFRQLPHGLVFIASIEDLAVDLRVGPFQRFNIEVRNVFYVDVGPFL